MQTRCPHCHQPIEILSDSSMSDLTCPACDSKFSLVDDRTLTFREDEHRKIGHFELRQKLGMGAFGTVWKAHDSDLDRTVAVKIPREAQLSSRDAELFLREARAAAQLNHPHIVSIHEVGREDDTTYIVSDYVEGLNLADRLTGRPLSFSEAAELCMKVAGALEHAHQAGVVHRDLKPSNIMLDSGGEPHIMDFGLAKRETGEITMTIAGAVLGTPAYMSPEQAKGQSHEADARSDIYSLGVILFELLTGEQPFRGNKLMIIHQVMHDDPPSPRKLNGAIPRDMETICLQCLEKEPGRRYLTAGQLGNDLRRYINGEPVLAQPPSASYLIKKYVKKNRGPVAAAMVIILLLVAGIAASGWFAISAEAKKFEADKARWLANEAARKAHVSEQKAIQARVSADQNRLRAEELQNDISVNAGRILCESGKVRHGLLLLAKGLAEAPPSKVSHLNQLRAEIASWMQSTLHLERLIHAPEARKKTEKGSVFAVSSSGRYFAFPRSAKPSDDLQVWDTTTGKQLAIPPLPISGGTRSIAFAPNERFLILGTHAGECVLIWLTNLQEPPAIVFSDTAAVASIDISDDGKLLATGHDNGNVHIRQFGSLESAHATIKQEHTKIVWDVRFNSKGDQLATASGDGTARVWDPMTGAALSAPLIHTTEVLCVAFSPDGELLATGCGDGGARIWNVDSGKLDKHQFRDTSRIVSVAFNPDGDILATGCQSPSVRLWSLDTGQQVGETIPGGSDASFVDDGRFLCSAGIREARLWRYESSSNYHILPHSECVGALAYHPNGTYLLTGTANELSGKGQTQIWDVNRRTIVGKPIVHPHSVVSVAFNPTGDRFLVGTGHIQLTPGQATLHDTKTGHLIGEPIPHSGGAIAVAFNPDGKSFATGGGGQSVRIWDATTLKQVNELKCGKITLALKYLPNGKVLAIGLYASKALLWDLDSGESVELINSAISIPGVAVSPDGQTIVTAGGDSTAQFWDLKTRKQTGQIVQHTSSWIRPVVFSPDGRLLLTGGGDRFVRLWDVSTGQVVRRPLLHPDLVFAAAFSPDGRTVAGGCGTPYSLFGSGGEVRLWNIAPARIPTDKLVVLRVELLTGMRLNETGQAVQLQPQEWLQRHKHWLASERQ